MKMRTCRWFFLFLSFGLHVLSMAILLWNAAVFQTPLTSKGSARVTEVSLLVNQVGVPVHQRQVEFEASDTDWVGSPTPAMLWEETSFAEPSDPPGKVFILPPQELLYLPGKELDVRPQATVPIIIPFPDAEIGMSKGTAVLRLFVGADGGVDRIEIDESNLPPLFERAAMDAFMQAKMQPGIKNGRRTRALMKVLVEFEEK